MNDAQFAELVAWIADQGLAGEEEPELVSGFCTRAVAFGLRLMRAAVLIDTLHPLYEGHFFGWQADGKTTLREYGSSREGEGAGALAQKSILSPGGKRRAAAAAPDQCRKSGGISVIADLAPDATEFVAMVHRFKAQGIIGEMDSVYSSWATDRSERLSRCRRRRPRKAGAAVGAGGEIGFADVDRAHAGRDLSRPRSRPARARRRHRARCGRPDRFGAVVQRPARLHAHHRYVAAGAGDPAAQRLCRCDHLGHPRSRRRCAQADRRRHARDF